MFLLLSAALAAPVTLDFDDGTTGTSLGTYQGYVVSPSTAQFYDNLNNSHGPPRSGSQVLLNNTRSTPDMVFVRDGGGTFRVVEGYLSDYDAGGIDARVEGYLGGSQVFSLTFTDIPGSSWVRFAPDELVDELRFVTTTSSGALQVDDLTLDVDLCLGDDSTGDPDGNGICADLDTERCDGFDSIGDGDADEANHCGCLAGSVDGQSYLACRAFTDWSTADRVCQQLGQQLAVFETPTEHVSVGRRLGRTWPFRGWWIGLDDLDGNGVWDWSDGSPLGWSAFTSALGAGDCGGFFPANDVWYQVDCTVDAGFLCETAP